MLDVYVCFSNQAVLKRLAGKLPPAAHVLTLRIEVKKGFFAAALADHLCAGVSGQFFGSPVPEGYLSLSGRKNDSIEEILQQSLVERQVGMQFLHDGGVRHRLLLAQYVYYRL